MDGVMEELWREPKGVTAKTYFLGEVGATEEEGYQEFSSRQVVRFRRGHTIHAQQVL